MTTLSGFLGTIAPIGATGPAGSGGVAWQPVQTSSFTAVSGRGYPVDTTSGAVTVTLPASPSAGNFVTVVDYAGTSETNNITVTGNGSNIQGRTDNLSIVVNRQAYNFVYINSTQGWISYAQEYIAGVQAYEASYLIVAGGGGGGAQVGGGGGAGGLLQGSIFVSSGTTYTFVVGAGGNGTTGNGQSSQSGAQSSALGLTAIGGGGGGSYLPGDTLRNGKNGGSGGGAGAPSATFGTGTVGQGNNGGTSFDNQWGAGGGGGRGAAGTNGTSSTGGTGGIGIQSSITGTATYYAGGGGGASDVGQITSNR
jgi:hypothetical protein